LPRRAYHARTSAGTLRLLAIAAHYTHQLGYQVILTTSSRLYANVAQQRGILLSGFVVDIVGNLALGAIP